jgi:hypothetical protein
MEDLSDDVECDEIGSCLLEDFSGNKFYNSFMNRLTQLVVKRGDAVRVRLDNDEVVAQAAAGEESRQYESFGYGQVNAIFITKDNQMLVEIRWLNMPSEIPQVRKKT